METATETATEPTAWSRALRDPKLQDLPYKVETNEWGQIVLSPHKLRHSLQQSCLLRLLLLRLLDEHAPDDGTSTVAFAVETPKGVKVPDVVWISHGRLDPLPDDAEASPVAPEVVIEVLSASNTAAEMEAKRRLYFEAGAHEVWLCDEEGRLTFYDPSGEIPASALAPSFPASLS